MLEGEQIILKALMIKLSESDNRLVREYLENPESIEIITHKLSKILSMHSIEEMKFTQEQLDSIDINMENPIHLIAEILGEVLEEYDFNCDVVDQAKKLFIVIKFNKKRQGFQKKISVQINRQRSSMVESVNLGILGPKSTS